jgi:hypothetical protein
VSPGCHSRECMAYRNTGMLFIGGAHPLNTRESAIVHANTILLIMPIVQVFLLCLVGCCDGGRKHGGLVFVLPFAKHDR